MASYRGHLLFASALGAGYGALGVWQLSFGRGPALLAAGLTAVAGLLPDLDSASGVPQRVTSGLLGVVAPLLLLRLLIRDNAPLDETIVLVLLAYVVIRYGLSRLFKQLTVHRGMFHSLPAMFIAGLAVFLLDHGSELAVRLYLAGGVMLGFLSHLVLDELCSVDFMGMHLKKSAGSALKLASKSWGATLTCYALLAALGYLTWRDLTATTGPP
ncbi:MAG TPA: metal-dependent hydrolase [Gemmataceae bacterium]|nr:metal-dependent hydrolase [Gemmataceae bacterium]